MTDIVDQPPPVATDRRPAWELVIEYTQKMVEARRSTAGALVIADMRERDQLGRARYGTPLTAGNGRNQLVDAYQEALDFAVYLAAYLDERGVQLDGAPSTFRLMSIKDLFVKHLRTVLRLRYLLEDPT